MLHPEVAATVIANVAQSLEAAEMQAAGLDPAADRDEDEAETEDEPAAG
jgi:hypothetical protein